LWIPTQRGRRRWEGRKTVNVKSEIKNIWCRQNNSRKMIKKWIHSFMSIKWFKLHRGWFPHKKMEVVSTAWCSGFKSRLQSKILMKKTDTVFLGNLTYTSKKSKIFFCPFWPLSKWELFGAVTEIGSWLKSNRQIKFYFLKSQAVIYIIMSITGCFLLMCLLFPCSNLMRGK